MALRQTTIKTEGRKGRAKWNKINSKRTGSVRGQQTRSYIFSARLATSCVPVSSLFLGRSLLLALVLISWQPRPCGSTIAQVNLLPTCAPTSELRKKVLFSSQSLPLSVSPAFLTPCPYLSALHRCSPCAQFASVISSPVFAFSSDRSARGPKSERSNRRVI